MHVKFGALAIGFALCLATGVSHGASAVQWQPSLERAKILAAHSNRLVLVHFWGNGCPPCAWMEREVFTRPEVGQAVDQAFVAVKINKSQLPGTASQFGVVAVPTDVIITPQGQILEKFQGSAPPAQFINRLTQVAQRNMPAVRGPATQAYASQMPAANGQGGYPPPVPPTQPQLNSGYSVGAPANSFASSNPPQPQLPAVGDQNLAQAAPRYSDQYNGGNGYAQGLASNQAGLAPQGMSPPVSATTQPGLPPSSPTAYPANPQMPQAGAMANQAIPPMQQGGQPANPAGMGGNPPLALEGFCPVSLERTMRSDNPQWIRGDARWGAQHEGRTYLFAGPDEQKAFFDNPNFYAPVLSGNDAVFQVERGQQIRGLREFGARWKDHVYLFSSKESFEKFQANPTFYESRVLGTQQAVAGPAGQLPSANADAAMYQGYGYR